MPIPKLLHFIWIKHVDKASGFDIPDEFYKRALRTLKLVEETNKKDKTKWKLNLWVDCNTERLANVRKLASKGFSINNIKDGVFDLVPGEVDTLYSSEMHRKFFQVSYVTGIKADLVKYQILKKYGGVVNDFNFIYERLPSNDELRDNSLILYKHHKTDLTKSYIENCFIASARSSSFIKRVQKEVMIKADANPHCVRDFVEFPQDDLQQLFDLSQSLTQAEAKSLYCSTVVTTEPLDELYKNYSSFLPLTLVTLVVGTHCVGEPCFGYDYVHHGSDTPVQSHM